MELEGAAVDSIALDQPAEGPPVLHSIARGLRDIAVVLRERIDQVAALEGFDRLRT